ncbi:hypothetical protein AAFC00_004505 [Neodothiora populina]|uniref:Zn(2)-C6 fungal-type domain-containing protein n=1 Tax=Neodothiora populina TaxID=2781224 RepID=A0ABR3P2K0_9PEZI
MTDPESGSTPLGIIAARACDNCRARKIRCDKATPCSNCSTAKITCHTSDRPPKEQRQRVLISNQYEQKIDAIEDRLTGIERLLHRLVENQSSQEPKVLSPKTDPRENEREHDAGQESIRPEHSATAQFEGESSLSASTQQAHSTLESLLGHNTNVRNDPDVSAALVALQEMQQHGWPNRHGSRLRVNRTSNGAAGTPEPLPPRSAAMEVIRAVKDTGDETILAWYWYMDFDADKFANDCKRFYDAPEQASVALQVIVHSGLYSMFSGHPLLIEHSPNKTDASGVAYRVYAERCLANLKNSLLKFPLILAPTIENITALATGSAQSIQAADFSLCWTLTCAGARLCQSLGWHRKNVINQDNPKEARIKKGLFWTIYFNDKCLSLRLGVSSTFQDYDVALEYPEPPTDPRWVNWGLFAHLALDVATLHGMIYEKLYSPGASTSTVEQRMHAVEDLARQIQDAAAKNEQMLKSPDFEQFYFKMLGESNEVLLDCLLTLVYRKMPMANTDPSHLSLSLNTYCINAARSAMLSHQKAIRTLQVASKDVWLEYFNWTILNTPFTPFMVIFTNCVNTLSLPDLSLLEDFVSSILLGPAYESSDTITRFHRLCDGFAKLAKSYIAASLRERQTSEVQQSKQNNTSRKRRKVDNTIPSGVHSTASPTYASTTPPDPQHQHQSSTTEHPSNPLFYSHQPNHPDPAPLSDDQSSNLFLSTPFEDWLTSESIGVNGLNQNLGLVSLGGFFSNTHQQHQQQQQQQHPSSSAFLSGFEYGYSNDTGSPGGFGYLPQQQQQQLGSTSDSVGAGGAGGGDAMTRTAGPGSGSAEAGNLTTNANATGTGTGVMMTEWWPAFGTL